MTTNRIKGIADIVPEVQATGNCYQSAFETLVDNGKESLRLVHGVVVGQGKIEGVKHIHAWVECSKMDLVFDFSNGKGLVCTKELYYRIGQIDEATCVRYTKTEACIMAAKHLHYGAWDEKLVQLLNSGEVL